VTWGTERRTHFCEPSRTGCVGTSSWILDFVLVRGLLRGLGPLDGWEIEKGDVLAIATVCDEVDCV